MFDADLHVFGYELLFRSEGAGSDPDAMTADVLAHAALDIGLDNLVGSKMAFVNAPRAFVLGEYEIPLPPERTVVEVLETVRRDEAAVSGCRRLADAGYTLALDDYMWEPGDEPLLEVAHLAKLDILAIPTDELETHARRCSSFGLRLVAEKVETWPQLRQCSDLGFDLFQGYLFSRPELVAGAMLDPGRISCLQLVEKLCDPDLPGSEVEKIIKSDPGLAHRFLRAAGTGAADGLRSPVRSIRHGATIMGTRRLRSWATVMLLAGAGRASSDQMVLGMTRARMSELIAERTGRASPDEAFTAGLLSSLEFLMNVPIAEVTSTMSISEDLTDAVISRSGPLGTILADVLAWEGDDPDVTLGSGIGEGDMERCYLEALSWAETLCSTLEE